MSNVKVYMSLLMDFAKTAIEFERFVFPDGSIGFALKKEEQTTLCVAFSDGTCETVVRLVYWDKYGNSAKYSPCGVNPIAIFNRYVIDSDFLEKCNELSEKSFLNDFGKITSKTDEEKEADMKNQVRDMLAAALGGAPIEKEPKEITPPDWVLEEIENIEKDKES